MQYKNIHSARFLSRPNRFIALAELDGEEVVCHVKNTGRCRELLLPGANILLEKSDKENRKTKYDLVSVYKETLLINMDSQAPNRLFAEWVQGGGLFHDVSLLRPETTFASSRFDFYLEADGKKIFAEIKGVTLEENGVALFPDAPTERGVKHLKELCFAVEQGFSAYVVFVVQMKGVSCFMPNHKMHPAFANALKHAASCGVQVVAVDCNVKPDRVQISDFVPVCLSDEAFAPPLYSL